VNERGDRLPEDQLVMQISRGLTGTRGADGTLEVTQRPQELFISNPSGTSDTILIAYAIRPVPDSPAGSYRGVLRFTVESLDTGAVATQTLNVQATIQTTLALQWEGAATSDLRFGEVPGESSSTQELVLGIVNNTALPTHVLQELVEPLSNGRGDRLPVEALTYAVVSDVGGGSWQPVADHLETVVTDDRGTLRALHLSYAVSVDAAQFAGEYRGSLRLRLTVPGGPPADEILVPVELSVREVFTMSVTPVDGGPSTLHFESLPSGNEAVERRLRVEIRTNMGRPYQVLAGLDHPLVLPTGETLPPESLVWSIPQPERGTVLLAPNAPVAVGYEPLYQSDERGAPENFLLVYHLTVPADAREGLYAGQLRFTITLF
jgi:hypothetical protein